jgi:pyruvate kinase
MMHSGKLTKIVSTVGPACEDPKVLKEMILAGVNVFRFNMKHNSTKWHQDMIDKVQKVADELKIRIGVLMDLQGPEIRIETPNEKDIKLKKGEQILFVPEFDSPERKKDEKCVRLGQIIVLDTLEVGDPFSIEDGRHQFKVTKKVGKHALYAKMLERGVVKNRKSLNLVGKDVALPSLIDADLDKLDMAAKTKVDFVALSFVRSRRDLDILRHELSKRQVDARVIAKVESQKGLDNIDEIIEYSDGIMYARGDLGVETPIEKITFMQKSIVNKCRAANKPIIVATQMLESMMVKSLPARSDAADVANAAYDKTDAVMLSGETAMGKYPVKVVETMAKILKFNEMQTETLDSVVSVQDQTQSLARAGIEMISHAEMKIDKVLVFTESGRTARVFSSFRPKIPVIAVSNNSKTVETLTLSFGVITYQAGFDSEEYHEPPKILKDLVGFGLLEKGDTVLLLHGQRWMDENRTNALAVLSV